jgi:NitT/TauT family transport system substrate-binding protein
MIIMLLWACTTTTTPDATPEMPALQKVRLALNWYPEPEFGGFYEAQLSGLYKEAGLDVEIIPGGPGAPSLELLASGRAEAAITAADDLLIKRSRGIEAVGVFSVFQDAPMGVMVHKSSGIESFEDIKDGQIAIEIGSSFQSFLWSRYSWGDAVRPIPYGGGVGAFMNDKAHRQQAYITSEPCVARGQGAEVTFLKAVDAGWNPYSVLLAVTDPPPPWTEALVEATRAGWEAYMASPAQANAAIAKLNDQLEPSLLSCITDAQRPFVTGSAGVAAGSMTAARWDATAAALVELELLPAGSAATGAWRGN